MAYDQTVTFRNTPAACDPNLPAAQCLEWHIRPHLVKAQIYKGDPAKGFGDGYRARCPAHDDGDPSFTINVGLRCLWYQCYAGCDQLAVRAALISDGVPPRCLLVPKERSAQLADQLADVLTSGGMEDGHKVLLALAYIRGMGELPKGNALEALAAEAGVSRPSAYRYRKAGLQPTSRTYIPSQDQIKDPSSDRRVGQPEKSHGETSVSRRDLSEPSGSLTVRPQAIGNLRKAPRKTGTREMRKGRIA